MESLCYSAIKESEDAYDVSTSLTERDRAQDSGGLPRVGSGQASEKNSTKAADWSTVKRVSCVRREHIWELQEGLGWEEGQLA